MLDNYPDLKVMPSNQELPSTPQGLSGHMADNWHAVVKTVDVIKGNATRNKRYESESTRLSNGMDQLRALSTRLNSLLGNPIDGIQFGLIAIADKVEAALVELGDALNKEVRPKIEKAFHEAALTTADMEHF
jgi:hypothetical protein